MQYRPPSPQGEEPTVMLKHESSKYIRNDRQYPTCQDQQTVWFRPRGLDET